MPRTQAQYVTSIRERLDEPTATFWTDVELRRWINEAARDMARRTETIQATDTVNIVAATQQYTLANDVLRVYRMEFVPTGDTNTYPIEFMGLNEMDSLWYTRKTTTPGDPRVAALWGFTPNLNVTLYPTPSRAGVLTVYVYRLPPDLATDGSAGSTSVEVPEGWEDLVVEYVLYQANLKDGNPDWQASKQLYDAKLDAMYQLTRRWHDQSGMIVSDIGNTMVPRWIWDFSF